MNHSDPVLDDLTVVVQDAVLHRNEARLTYALWSDRTGLDPAVALRNEPDRRADDVTHPQSESPACKT